MIREEYINAIKEYILLAKMEKVLYSDFYLEDEQLSGFPSFESILSYVNKSSSVDKFFEKLNEVIINYGKYIHGNEQTSISLKEDMLLKRVKISEDTIKKLLSVMDEKIEFQKLSTHKINKIIKTSFKVESLDSLNFLYDLLSKLFFKVKDYIVKNSIYNSSYKVDYKSIVNELKKEKPIKTLSSITEDTKKIIDKKYIPDFLSDGTEDITEMMNAFWTGLETLLFFTNPIEVVSYSIDNEEGILNITEWFKKEIDNHFEPLNSLLLKNNFDKYKDSEIRTKYEKLKTINIPKTINPRSELDLPTEKCDAEKKLEELIGLNSVKEAIEKIKNYVKLKKDSKTPLNLHMAFYGNPGTGKTEVAKLVGEILKHYGALPSKKCIVASRSDLVGQYIGETAIKTQKLIASAMGGVLFIDEAYSLATKGDSVDFGNEAVAELIKEMEDNQGKFCVILAGYKNKLQKMISTNPGFKSRIQFHIDFENYNRDEMSEIMKLMVKHDGYSITDEALEKMLDISDVFRKSDDFANARTARNIIQQCEMCLGLRVTDLDDKKIVLEDVEKYIKDSKLEVYGGLKEEKILSGEEQLENLVGLDSVKTTIKKIKAYAKKNKGTPNLNLHMAFTGNPGTGKTEVANIISRILYEAGILPEAKVVLGNRETLVGKYIGETAIKTKEAVQKAMGGVLFVDEAYSLSSGGSTNDYGAEAIATLIDEMEKYKGKFTVVLAGYEKPLQQMISTNPGFKSRIQFYINFPDYSRDELRQIALSFLKKENVSYTITEDAMEEILDIADYYRSQSDFANARTMRTMLQDIIMNQNLRTEEELGNDQIIIDDVLEYVSEKHLDKLKNNKRAESAVSNESIAKLISASLSFDSSKIDLTYYEQAVVSISGENSQGTGFIVSPDGLCMTCAHCVEDDGLKQKVRIVLTLMDGQKFNNYIGFKVFYIDEKNDLALLKLDSMGMNYKFLPLTLENNSKFVPLQEFIMAGYPFGGELFTSISIIEGKIASINQYNGREVVFADMFGKSGSSGSPVIDKNTKKVIGIFWGGIADLDSKEVINCFTPSDSIWKSLNNR